jgi:hypothetical protein
LESTSNARGGGSRATPFLIYFDGNWDVSPVTKIQIFAAENAPFVQFPAITGMATTAIRWNGSNIREVGVTIRLQRKRIHRRPLVVQAGLGCVLPDRKNPIIAAAGGAGGM